MIKLITLALCAVLVISCVEQVYGGVQHVKSESVKDGKAQIPAAETPSASSKAQNSTTQAPITPPKTPSSPTKAQNSTTQSPSPPTNVTIPTTEAPTNATTAKPTPPHCQPGDRKAVEHSCRDYLECDSQFKWANKTCSTFCKVFEPKSAKCVWNWQSPCLKPPTTVAPPPSPTDNPTKGSTDAPTEAPSTPTTNTPECTEGSVKPVKGNCKDYLTCKSNKWVETSCSFGYDFDINKHSCTWSWWAKC